MSGLFPLQVGIEPGGNIATIGFEINNVNLASQSCSVVGHCVRLLDSFLFHVPLLYMKSRVLHMPGSQLKMPALIGLAELALAWIFLYHHADWLSRLIYKSYQ